MDGLKSELTGCPLVSTFRMCGQKVHSVHNRGHLDHHIPWLTPGGDIAGETLMGLGGGGGEEGGTCLEKKGKKGKKEIVWFVIKLSLPGSGERSGSRPTEESLRSSTRKAEVGQVELVHPENLQQKMPPSISECHFN